LNNLQN